MFAMEVTTTNLDVIKAANGGVEPVVEDEGSYFIYYGEDTYSDIIPPDQFNELREKTGIRLAGVFWK